MSWIDCCQSQASRLSLSLRRAKDPLAQITRAVWLQALQHALEEFAGTVIAVTHDRWFMRSLDRYVLFRLDGSVGEAFDADTAVRTIDDPDFEPGPGSFTWLTGGR